ncbi:MAG: hypothetical protein DRI46_11405 [Chloroflexi bacterium]|nr:MAG: hypothetical protein DRI46_11405 [Chloroflexota bacterium]
MDDQMLEAEAAQEAFVDEHWHNLETFHNFIFTEVDKFTFVPPRVNLYIRKAESRDQLHTNDMFTPRTFAWMLLNFEDLREMWISYLRKEFHNDNR